MELGGIFTKSKQKKVLLKYHHRKFLIVSTHTMVNFVTFCPIIILTSIFNQLNQLWLKKYNKHAYLGHFFVQQNIINWTFFDKLGHSYQLNTNPSCNSTNTSVKILHLITHWRVLSNLTYKIDSFLIFHVITFSLKTNYIINTTEFQNQCPPNCHSVSNCT